MNLLTHGGLGLLRGERDGQVRGPLADARRAPHGTRAEALERRTLVGVHGLDPQLLADELVVVLGVGDRRLQQLQPRLGGAAGREREDRARLDDVLAADVVAHQPRLAGGRAHVLGLGADGESDRDGALGVAPAARGLLGLLGGLGVLLGRGLLLRRGLLGRLGLVFVLGRLLLGGGLLLGGLCGLGVLRLGARGPLGGRGRLLGGLLGLVGGLLGLARLARALGLRLLRSGRGGLLGLLRELLGLLRRSDGGRGGGLLGGLSGLLGGGGGACRLLVRSLLLVLDRLVALFVGHRTLPLESCPRYVRVGANSPSLCPTIDSLTNTGTCLRPSWTAIV